MKQHAEKYGWVAVPRNGSNTPSHYPADAPAVNVNFDEIWPVSDLVRQTETYVLKHLPKATLDHSKRVYCYGHAMVTVHFPSWIADDEASFFETWALVCLLHDIATTDENRRSTHLSFEFQGGIIALQKLQSFGAPQVQAELACEAIIRHQDPGETGMLPRIGQLAQLATAFDNMGYQPYLLPKGVIEQVVKQFPRIKWSGCFAQTITDELEAKPWCHTSSMANFKEDVLGNKLMEPYDG